MPSIRKLILSRLCSVKMHQFYLQILPILIVIPMQA